MSKEDRDGTTGAAWVPVFLRVYWVLMGFIAVHMDDGGRTFFLFSVLTMGFMGDIVFCGIH